MSEVTIQCPYCNNALNVDSQWNGMSANCPFCSKAFNIQIPAPTVIPVQTPMNVPQQPAYPQQSAYPQQVAYPQQAAYPQQPAYSQQAYAGMPQAGYGNMLPQGVGAKFQLMPGERLLMQNNFTICTFPAGYTCARLTDQRLTFCHISPWLIYLVSWLFMYSSPTKISLTFTRNDIANVEVQSGFFRKKLTITDCYGQKFSFYPYGFSKDSMLRIFNWWQCGN